MNTLILSLWSLLSFSDIYSITIPGINGSAPIHFSDFAGKRILIVNTASKSDFVEQYSKLEELYQQNKDSLVIIAVPSNDFGNEPDDEATIQSFVQDTYHIHFLLAGKANVKEDHPSDLYKWLTDASENSVMGSKVKYDFQKYLIEPDGRLSWFFAGAVDPLDPTLLNAIHGQ